MTVIWPGPFPVLVKMAESEQVGDNEFFDEMEQAGARRKSNGLLLLHAETGRSRPGIAMQIAMILNSMFRCDGRCSPPGFKEQRHRVGVVRERDDAHLKCVAPLFATVYRVKIEVSFYRSIVGRSKPRIAILDLRYLFGCENRHLLVSLSQRAHGFGGFWITVGPVTTAARATDFFASSAITLSPPSSLRAWTASSSHSPRCSRPLSATQS